MNLPPFYIGQKVVCLSSTWTKKIKKWLFTILVKSTGPQKNDICTASLVYFSDNQWYMTLIEYPKNMGYTCVDFAPVKQTKFQAMSFTQIKETEKEEILINN